MKHHACYCNTLGGYIAVCDFCAGMREHCGDESCRECNPQVMTNQQQVRAAFWQAWRDGRFQGLNVTPRRITDYSGNGKMYNTDTRTAFCDFVDSLNRDGQLADGLADRVTL